MVHHNRSRQENNSLSNLSIILKSNIILTKAQVLLKLMIRKVLSISCPLLAFVWIFRTVHSTLLQIQSKQRAMQREIATWFDMTWNILGTFGIH